MSGFAASNSVDTNAAQDPDLISPPFDLTGQKSADLRFQSMSVLPAGSEEHVSVTTDGGNVSVGQRRALGGGLVKGNVLDANDHQPVNAPPSRTRPSVSRTA
ncbi:hypothetical protein [Streptomyces sp. NPDC005125]